MEPHFRMRSDNTPNYSDTKEALQLKKNQEWKWMKPLPPDVVLEKARKALIQHGGDPSNRKHLLGFIEIQFGPFRGQTFKWVVENSLGLAAYLVAAMNRDPAGGSKDAPDHAHNKMLLKEYLELFPAGRIAIQKKQEDYEKKGSQRSTTSQSQLSATTQHPGTSQHSATSKSQPSATTQHPGTSQRSATSSLSSLLVGKLPHQQSLTKTVQRLVSPSKAKPCKQTQTFVKLYV